MWYHTGASLPLYRKVPQFYLQSTINEPLYCPFFPYYITALTIYIYLCDLMNISYDKSVEVTL